MIIFTRFRDLPDEQMKHIVDYVESGRPIIGLRTATHAFNIKESKTYAKYAWNGKESGRGRLRPQGARRDLDQPPRQPRQAEHARHHRPGRAGPPDPPGIKDGDIWGPTDVYGVRLPLPGDSKPLVLGQVLDGMKPTDTPVAGQEERPDDADRLDEDLHRRARARPRASSRRRWGPRRTSRAKACAGCWSTPAYWAVGLEDKIPAKADVAIVGEYQPLPFGFGGFKKGVKPSSHEIK